MAVFPSAAMQARPDAADFFPHHWMIQAESQRFVRPTFPKHVVDCTLCSFPYMAAPDVIFKP